MKSFEDTATKWLFSVSAYKTVAVKGYVDSKLRVRECIVLVGSLCPGDREKHYVGESRIVKNERNSRETNQ